MKDRHKKEGVVAPCELDTTTRNHVLEDCIIAGQNSLSTKKKGACGREKVRKGPQGTPVVRTKDIIPAESSFASSKIAKRRADMPPKYRKLYDRCMAGKASPRDAIKMQCIECWGWVKGETEKCDNYACPLHRYRPYQGPVKSPTERLGAPSTDERAQIQG